jgi:hypothetical protein
MRHITCPSPTTGASDLSGRYELSATNMSRHQAGPAQSPRLPAEKRGHTDTNLDLRIELQHHAIPTIELISKYVQSCTDLHNIILAIQIQAGGM